MSEYNKELTPEVRRAFLFQENLADLDTKRNETYLANDVNGWLKVCNRIFVNISFRLTIQEYNTLEKMFVKCKEKVVAKDVSVVDDIRLFEVLLLKFQNDHRLLYPVERILQDSKKTNRPDRKNSTETIEEFEDEFT